jgi:hypothetical protein
VATDEVELDLAGEDGRALAKPAARGGDGAVKELAEFLWWCDGGGNGEGGANTLVGVGAGVCWFVAAGPLGVGFFNVGISPW